jgi:uncharacterized protein (TIGR02302 family)
LDVIKSQQRPEIPGKRDVAVNPQFNPGRVLSVLAFAGETWERLWPLLVPFFMTLCLFATLSWFGLWLVVPEWVRWASLGLFALALIATLYLATRFKLPEKAEILCRIERATGISHRPVTAQIDKPANIEDEFSTALWREHQKRMARKLDNLAVGEPRPDGNLFDLYAFRVILPLFAFVAFGFSFGPTGGRLGDILEPKLDKAQVLSRLDVWINAPAYAAKPPLYLSQLPQGNQEDLAELPQATTLSGSEILVRYVGSEPVSARFMIGDIAQALEPPAEAAPGTVSTETSLSGKPDQSGILQILARKEVIAAWNITLMPDAIPQIKLEEMPSAALSGSLELTYSVSDDYGVVSARGLIRSIESEKPGARPLVEAPELQLPLPRARAKSGTTKVNRDLSGHPWAGSEVELTLEATDDPGQVGRSMPMKIMLPGRTFVDPMAKALVEQRRILAKDANSAKYVASLLDAVTTHADYFNIDAKAYLALQTAYHMIAPANDDERLREAMDILWETALAIELGDLSDVERKLREAQEKLSEALENNASDEEIDRLMDELRQAMNDFLEQLQKEMARNPIQQNPLAGMENRQTLTQRDIDKMMQRIEDLAKSGSKDAARELLAEMQRMMDNLRAGQHQQQRQAEGNELNEALDKLSELMQRQQQLMDETFSMQRRQSQSPQNGEQQDQQQGQQQQGQQEQGQQQRGDQQNGQPPGSEGEPGEMTAEELADALESLRQQQQALQDQLGELGKQLEDLGLDPSAEFGEAGDEMGQAGDNLGKGDTGAAAGDQGQALEALRRGAQSMMEQMAGDRNQGGQQPGEQGTNEQAQSQTDPLGRRNGPNGRINDESTRIPGEIDAQRAREIMDAIRRKLSDPLGPLLERDYLERLLKSR